MKPAALILTEAVIAHFKAGRTRATLKVPGFSKEDVTAEWNLRTRNLKRAEPRQARKSGPDVNEDGLLRLTKKRRLDACRLEQALRYRTLGREAELGGGAVKSCLNDTVGGGQSSGLPTDNGLADLSDSAAAAKRELFRLRWVVLKGEEDMRHVLDGVCIGGLTLKALAGGDGNRARELEAILKVALQLLHLEAHPPVQKAA